MIPDLDISRAAWVMIRRYGDDAGDPGGHARGRGAGSANGVPFRVAVRPARPVIAELGYRDYIGALQRYRAEHPRDVELLSMSSFLMDYPFAKQLFPGAIEVLKRLRSLAPTVIPSDGDVVFQPRKIEHAGLSEVVGGHVLIISTKTTPAMTSNAAIRLSTTSSWTTSCGSCGQSRNSGDGA